MTEPEPDIENPAAAAVDAYLAAWNEPDEGARRTQLESAVVDDFVFDGPTGAAAGIDAVLALIADARGFMPGAAVARLGPVEHRGGAGRPAAVAFRWEIRAVEGHVAMAGTDVADLAADGRLARVRVASGPSAP